MKELERLLNYLEDIIDVDYYNSVIELQKRTLRFEKTDSICIRAAYPIREFRPFPMEETHKDMAKMMYNELLPCISTFEIKDTSLSGMIRANYGVGTLPSAFGVQSRIVGGNMPWVEHVSTDEVKEIISRGVPDYRTGFGQRVIETYEFYKETLSKYPKCRDTIRLFHPDFQGPLDVAHLIYGSDIYLDMYEDPELVHELLSLVTETYIDRMKRLKPYLDDEIDEFCFHWKHLYPGKIVLRNDSAVALSPDMYKEFAMQYDDRIYEAFGPASMHFCGRADHWVFDMAKSDNILALQFGHMQKLVFGMEYLDFIAPAFFDKKKAVLGYVLTREDFEKMDFEKYSTGITYQINARSKEEAMEYLARCKNSK